MFKVEREVERERERRMGNCATVDLRVRDLRTQERMLRCVVRRNRALAVIDDDSDNNEAGCATTRRSSRQPVDLSALQLGVGSVQRARIRSSSGGREGEM